MTCRLFYAEASLVPFKANIFTFAAPKPADKFLQRLTLEQNAAICEVGFTQANGMCNWASKGHDGQEKKPQPAKSSRTFRGVKRVRVSVELCSVDAQESKNLTTVEGQDDFLVFLNTFKFPEVYEVEVKITAKYVRGHYSEKYRFLSVAEVKAWEARVKGRVLSSAIGDGREFASGVDDKEL